MKPLYSVCYSIDDILDGEKLIAGGSFLSNGQSSHLVADHAQLEPLFQDADAIYQRMDPSKIAQILKDNDANIETGTFCRLTAIQRAIQNAECIGRTHDANARRRGMYEAGEPALSSLIAARCVQCTEAAAIANAYLNRQGIQNSFFSGAVYWPTSSGDDFHEFAEAHCFNIVKGSGHVTLYDPANPMQGGNGLHLPSLYDIPASAFAAFEMRAQHQPALLPLENMIGRQKALYGVNAPDCSYLPKHIVRLPAETPLDSAAARPANRV